MSGAESRSARRWTWRRIRRSPLTHLVLAIVILALVQGFLVKPFQVPSESMSPTLETGDRILTSRVAVAVSDPGEGDVVVFSRPDSWGSRPARSPLRQAVGWIGDIVGFGPSNHDALVKRVIGQPGTTVRCCSSTGSVLVDDQELVEPYVQNDLPFVAGEQDCETTPRSPRCFGPVTVPADAYLVMGDNRANSSDSVIGCRSAPADSDCARFVPRGEVLAKVMTVIWPLNRAFGDLGP